MTNPAHTNCHSSFLPRGAGLRLNEVANILELYCSAVAARNLQIKPVHEAPPDLLPDRRDLPLTDGKTIYLAETAGRRSSIDEFDYFLVPAAHQAAYIEFGTFDLDLDVLFNKNLPDELLKVLEAVPFISHYDLFFRLFNNPRLARDIFFFVEDGRIDYRLCSRYCGLAPRLRRIATESLADRPLPASLPPLEALIECLARLSLGEHPIDHLPPEKRPVFEEMEDAYAPVMNLQATVTDSAVITIRIYSILRQYAPELFAAPESIATPVPGQEGNENYLPAHPVEFRGQTDFARIQINRALDFLEELEEDQAGMESPMSPEMLNKLIESGAKIKILGVTAEELRDSTGLFATDLKGLLQQKMKEIDPEHKKKLARFLDHAKAQLDEASRVYYYDEWDYLNGDYKRRWCRLREVAVEPGSGDEAAQIKREHSALIASIKRQYQRIRPEMLTKVKRLRDGEEVVLDHVIDAVIDRKAGVTPSYRVYQNRERRARDIATCFLLDLSASTDEWVVEDPHLHQRKPSHPRPNLLSALPHEVREEFEEAYSHPAGGKRVIDLEREALVIMAEALENLGDEYAIYGFSGYGRENVELFSIKEFSEKYSERVRRKIGAIEPKKSTRMGPAVRHALQKLNKTGRTMKILILLSDGYPQDFDYGPDRSSREYGLHDTMVALQEARNKSIHTFCITVDQAGNDYLHEMCGGRDYFIVKKPSTLPRILPRIYRRLTV
ncbi:MAG: VWA domain-containing protein [Candidatus Abyssobacteria bacterium SURF_5]|uniref:VWA domain-containing protein n=1 Tax=Abyssobacteria bacterium (strain SURF_5) TaxID=2093360 RepID=A0A3A4NLX8_ABYX5|nr:MAG: VWA domain-containing protein [Candidatus Abyssubacteria bacterium SURF_5]